MSDLNDLILSIRDVIPDRTEGEDPHIDGRAFSLATLLRWINQAGKLICQNAPVIQDWYAVSTIAGQDVYALPNYITSVEQAWLDLLPLDRSAEGDNIFNTRVNGQSWWFSPHAIHAAPRLTVWPAPTTTAGSTQLNGSVTSTSTTWVVDSSTNFNQYGYAFAEGELVRFASKADATHLSFLSRGEGATVAAGHADNTAVTEGNLILKVYRLPKEVTAADDVLEVPRGLHPLIELFVLSKVRSTEQDENSATQLRQEFFQAITSLSDKAPTKGIRQGIQVKQMLPNQYLSRLVMP